MAMPSYFHINLSVDVSHLRKGCDFRQNCLPQLWQFLKKLEIEGYLLATLRATDKTNPSAKRGRGSASQCLLQISKLDYLNTGLPQHHSLETHSCSERVSVDTTGTGTGKDALP